MNKNIKIYISGHTGMLGASLLRLLNQQGYGNIVLRSRAQLDLACQADVDRFFAEEAPEVVFHVAAKTGGVMQMKETPVDFVYDNAIMNLNVIKAAANTGVTHLYNVASAYIYPSDVENPIVEEFCGAGRLDAVGDGYGLAKCLSIKLCDSINQAYGFRYSTLVPPALYGVGDTRQSVSRMLIQKFLAATAEQSDRVEIWGTGNARREFLHVDDCAQALLFAATHDIKPGLYNCGYGRDYSIREFAQMLQRISGFRGELFFDANKPEGALQLFLDSSKLFNLGWKPEIGLEQGMSQLYNEYQEGRMK